MMKVEWKPIATAIYAEGHEIILWNGVKVVAGSGWEGGWVDHWYEWITPQPTHWMPLPPAPVRP